MCDYMYAKDIDANNLTVVQAEQEVNSLRRKLQLLEADLDQAETKNADLQEKKDELEHAVEELRRYAKKLSWRLSQLFYPSLPPSLPTYLPTSLTPFLSSSLPSSLSLCTF